MSDSLRLYGSYPIRLLYPWDSPGKNTGVGCHAPLQGIFLSQGLNLCLVCLAVAGRFFTAHATWEGPYILVDTAIRTLRPFGMNSAMNMEMSKTQPPEKAMAPHSRTLAWKLPWMKEPGMLQSMGSRRVGHD